MANGRTLRSLAKEFGIGYFSKRRHRQNDFLGAMPGEDGASEPADEGDAGASLGKGPMADLIKDLRAKVKESGNPSWTRELRLALAAQEEWQAKQPAFNPVWDPDTDEVWRAFWERIQVELEKYPEALAVVLAAIRKHREEVKT